MRYLLISILVLLPAQAPAQSTAKMDKRDPTVRELEALLAEPLETNTFQKTLTLKEALKILQDAYRAKGKELPIQVNTPAFKEENPDAPDLYDTQITIADRPHRTTGARLLRLLLAQLPTNNGAFCLKPGFVDITTIERSRPYTLLGQSHEIRFARRPLHLALEDLYEQTGVAVVLDPRVGVRARTPITMNFTTDVSLGTAILLMSEVSGLKMIISDEIIFVTTPAIARQFLWERMANPYGLPE